MRGGAAVSRATLAFREGVVLPTEGERRAGFAVAVLDNVVVGVLAELEKAVVVAVAVLGERAVVAAAFLVDDAEIATAELGEAGHVVHALLGDLAALDGVHDAVDGEAGLDRILL